MLTQPAVRRLAKNSARMSALKCCVIRYSQDWSAPHWSILEYGCIVWDPHQTSRIQLLESVQNKGARYVMQDWDRHTSVSQMKLSLGWCTLQERRLVNRLSFFHKSVHKYHRLELPPYVMKPQRISKNHHSHSFQNIRAQSDQYLHSFLPRTIRTWNLLPQDIVTAPSPDSFRSS